MYIKEDYDFRDLQRKCWQGAEDTLKTIEEHDMEDEFMEFLEVYYEGEEPTIGQVNDLLWFEDDFIFEQIGLNLEEDEEEDEEE